MPSGQGMHGHQTIITGGKASSPFFRMLCRVLLRAAPTLAMGLALSLAPGFVPDAAKAAGTGMGMFNRPERPATLSDPWHAHIQPLWQRVLQAERTAPGFTAKAENFGPVDAGTWKNLVIYAKEVPEMEMFRTVNGYFNQWRPKNDADTWDTPEYWASPKEFIAKRGGDCEDYAIAKYFALRFLGVRADRLRIVVVRARDERGVPAANLHAVLAAKIGGNWFILDNNARPKDNIFPQAQYKGRFEPLYSLNENSAWVHGEQTGTPETSPETPR